MNKGIFGVSPPRSGIETYDFTPTSAPKTAVGSNGAYTWTIPNGAKQVRIICVSAGGGGGSGRRGAASTARFGSGGGASGYVNVVDFFPADLATSILTLSVAAGGAGGAAVTANDTNGNGGSQPSATTVYAGTAPILRLAPGVSAVAGGTATAGNGAGTGVNGSPVFVYFSSTGQSSTAGTPAVGSFPNANGPRGGGAGGGISAANAVGNGGPALIPQNWSNGDALDLLSGGVAPGGAGQAGSKFPSAFVPVGGGGSGGAASITGAAGNGGEGGFPGGGGGGGGASLNGNNSGAGGNGGGSLVRIIVQY